MTRSNCRPSSRKARSTWNTSPAIALGLTSGSKPLSRSAASAPSSASYGAIHVGDVRRAAGQRIDAERAGEAERVQHPPAAALRADDAPVLALIQVEAGLLPAQQVDREAQAVLGDLQVGRAAARPTRTPLRSGSPSCRRTDGIRALDDAARARTARPAGSSSSSRRASTPSVRNWTTSQSP